MHEIVKAIREKYPKNPGKRAGSPYCVGGALCLWLGGDYESHFPTHYELAQVLMFATDLPEYAAWDFATSIISANDEGRIEEAWQALSDAFSFVTDSTTSPS